MSLYHKNIQVDTHTHSLISGHAWSTVQENAAYAKSAGIKKICVTEHAPEMPGSGPYFFVTMLRALPEYIDGVGIVPGLEFNIMDFEGNLDITDSRSLEQVKFGIASCHDVCIKPGTKAQHTQSYINALNNPYVDIIGHPGTPKYPCDIQAVVQHAKRVDKLIEINNNSFVARKGCEENCIQFAKACMEHDVRICVSSDAHFSYSIGVVERCMAMLDELNFPEELILNLDVTKFDQYQQERCKRFKYSN